MYSLMVRRRQACVIASIRYAWTWCPASNASPVGAAEGCDLLILGLKKDQVKRSSERGPNLRQLLQLVSVLIN
ncbi:hypothetical protein EMIT0P258_80224 [Pseudomonas sp. IT-P258]